MSEAVLVDCKIDIAAPIDLVFDLLTQAEGLLEWIAVEAQSECRIGGQLRWCHENGAVMCGRYVEIDPPHRIVFTYGWESGGPDVPPESTRVTIELEETDGVTNLHLVHTQLPAAVTEEHRLGWVWFLGILADTARKKVS